MTIMYSPLGGWMDVIGGEIEDMKKKGWFLEGEDGFLPPGKQPLVKPPETGIVKPQPAAARRVGRPRRGVPPT